MSRGRAVFGAVAAALVVWLFCLGGAGTVANMAGFDSLRDAGSPVASPPARPVVTPSWSPAPAAGRDFETGLQHELESGVLAAAERPAPVTSGCDRRGRTFPCWVTYDGAKVTFTITITGSIPGDVGTLVNYSIAPDEVLVTREAVLRIAYGSHGFAPMRCDEFPPVSVVASGATMAQSCYFRPSPAQETRRERVRATGGWGGDAVTLEDAGVD